jgi:enoyl-CoA hydratase
MGNANYETKGRIGYVTLSRPNAMNALDDETNDELWAIWQQFSDDPAVDVAILTGAGKAFCAGVDLKTFIPKWEHANMMNLAAVRPGASAAGSRVANTA